MTLRRAVPFWAKKKAGGGYGPILYTPPLDTYSGAAFAVSSRKLRTAYTGDAFRVNDRVGTVTDVPYQSNGLVPDAEIEPLNSVGRGLALTSWYDQSTNIRDVSTVNDADINGPFIISDGGGDPASSVIQKVSGFLSPTNLGTNNNLFNSTPFMWSAGSVSIFAVIKSDTPLGSSTLIAEGRSTTSTPAYIPILRDSNTVGKTASFYRNDANSILLTSTLESSDGFNNNFNLVSLIDTGLTVNTYLNGVLGTPNSYTRSGTLTLDRFSIFGWKTTSNLVPFKGKIVELIVYASDKSADRVGIETALNSYYGIY